jgi:hypothetical protein
MPHLPGRRRLVQELTEADAIEVHNLLLEALPGAVEAAVREVEARIPRYTRLHDQEHTDLVPRTTVRAISGFLELLADRDASRDELWAYMREVGAVEAEEGLSRETSQAAFRLGAGVAIQRLTEVAQRHPSVTPSIIGNVAQAVLSYLNDIERALGDGHADASARRIGDIRQQRGALADMLLVPAPDQGRVGELADLVDWPLPTLVAVVVLGSPRHTTGSALDLAPDVLVGLHRDPACLVVPDPEGPGRRKMLTAGLRRWHAVLGPTVPLYDAGRSFELACQALRVSGGHGGLVTATDLLPSVILLRDRTLTDALIRARLAPLIDADFTQARAAELARTLKSCLDNDFNAVLVAELLQVHPQTIRYRIRTLTGLFGEGLRDPAHRLGLHMAVQAWLARPPGDGNPAP